MTNSLKTPTADVLSGKVAIVTGASRGIGRAIARKLAHDGAAVMLAARSESELAAAVGEITEAGGRAAFSVQDLREPAAADRLVRVNAINPGSVQTDRLHKRIQARAAELGISAENARQQMIEAAHLVRFGEAEEIAALVAFIVSPQGRWFQGSLIDIDGGETKTI